MIMNNICKLVVKCNSYFTKDYDMVIVGEWIGNIEQQEVNIHSPLKEINR
jgi:hypothetical protein